MTDMLHKEGWTLVFHEEFDGETLDQTKFSPYGLSHWKTLEEAKATYQLRDSCIVLQLPDEHKRVSAIVTGMRDGLHRYGDNFGLNHHDRAFMNLVTKYGYFELRAKVAKGSGLNSAWWMIGFENEKEQNAEVDIFEMLGKDTRLLNTTLHSLRDTKLKYAHIPYRTDVDLSEDFHVYGFEWDESGMKFYLDHELYWEIDQSPDYPMVTLLQINDGDGGWIGDLDRSIPYPKEFLVDYLRVYKREGMPMELIPLEGTEGNLARFAISGVGNDITWGDLYNAQSHICYINDGDPNTALISKPEESLPHYIYLDWMEPKAFDMVSLTTRAGLKHGPTQWDIEISPDGVSDWRKVGESGQVAWSYRENELETFEVRFAQVEQAKSIRLVIQAFNESQETGTYLIQDIAVYLSTKA
ncbi:glycoside hydrolase family 16 protein [Paenibacillus sp. FSL K6-1330]|uniref:glycoside hydrolase family 16 protein n=1 Tax=Paenibacillus sp. FSL K6-1330 TaxID=2975292 RepID=UPI0030D73901